MTPIIRLAARNDILRQFRYYLIDLDTPEVANRFVDAIERTVNNILLRPSAGAPKYFSNESLAGLRSWPVNGFEEIRVYYLVGKNFVSVVRVLHGKRDIRRILERGK